MLEITNHSCCFGIHACYTIWAHEGAISVPFVFYKEVRFYVFDHKGRRYVRRVQWVWIPQIATRSWSSSLHLNVANEDTNLPLALYKYVHAHNACDLVLQYRQSKQGFSSAWAVFMCRVKLWAVVNTLSQIIHGKRSGLFECCCLTRRNITCLYAKVK